MILHCVDLSTISLEGKGILIILMLIYTLLYLKLSCIKIKLRSYKNINFAEVYSIEVVIPWLFHFGQDTFQITANNYNSFCKYGAAHILFRLAYINNLWATVFALGLGGRGFEPGRILIYCKSNNYSIG